MRRVGIKLGYLHWVERWRLGRRGRLDTVGGQYVWGGEKTPELGSGLFAVSCEEDGVVFVEDSGGCLFKEYAPAVVA